ncbi:MAG: hypothetical protein QOF60_3234 [Actinomycetota bacterium]|jgi:hypothetical protein|nr:hypothetical protein [Actinomycetota bacterium]
MPNTKANPHGPKVVTKAAMAVPTRWRLRLAASRSEARAIPTTSNNSTPPDR